MKLKKRKGTRGTKGKDGDKQIANTDPTIAVWVETLSKRKAWDLDIKMQDCAAEMKRSSIGDGVCDETMEKVAEVGESQPREQP